jgi:hypothetical protein
VEEKLNTKPLRVAFQGEPGAFSEAAAVGLLGEAIETVPRPPSIAHSPRSATAPRIC